VPAPIRLSMRFCASVFLPNMGTSYGKVNVRVARTPAVPDS
jgi:hypothetical protein